MSGRTSDDSVDEDAARRLAPRVDGGGLQNVEEQWSGGGGGTTAGRQCVDHGSSSAFVNRHVGGQLVDVG